jgi:hypothetical protein
VSAPQGLTPRLTKEEHNRRDVQAPLKSQATYIVPSCGAKRRKKFKCVGFLLARSHATKQGKNKN